MYKNRFVGSILLLSLLVVSLGLIIYFPFAKVSDDQALVNDRNINSSAQIGISTNSSINSPAQNNSFDYLLQLGLTEFFMEFEDSSLDQEVIELILSDLEGLLGFRNYEKVEIPEDRNLTVITSGGQLRVLSYLNFYLENGRSRRIAPLVLGATSRAHLREIFGATFEYNGEETLYVPTELSDIYLGQLELRDSNLDAFSKLDSFIDRLNNLQAESDYRQALIDVLDMGSRNDEITTLGDDDVKKIIEGLSGKYNYVSLLDIAPAETLFNSSNLNQESDGILIANVEVKEAAVENMIGNTQIIFKDGSWFLWRII